MDKLVSKESKKEQAVKSEQTTCPGLLKSGGSVKGQKGPRTTAKNDQKEKSLKEQRNKGEIRTEGKNAKSG